MVAPVETALRKGTCLSLRSPGAGLGKVQHAAPGEEKEPLALWPGNGRKAGEPALAGTAGRWQASPASCAKRRKRGCQGDRRGGLGRGSFSTLRKESGQKEGLSCASGPKGQQLLGHLSRGHTWACHQAPGPELAETPPGGTGNQMPSASRMWQHWRRRGCPGKQGHFPITPHPRAWAVCSDPLASPHGWGRHWPSPLSTGTPEQKGRPSLRREMAL